MLQQFSWQLYFETVSVSLIIYYGLIGLKFYRAEIMALLDRKAPGIGQPVARSPVFAEEAETFKDSPVTVKEPVEEEADDTENQVDALIGELKKYIGAASAKPSAPAVLVPQLKKIVQSYPGLRDSPHRSAINELLVSECEKAGVAQLTEDEVNRWWVD